MYSLDTSSQCMFNQALSEKRQFKTEARKKYLQSKAITHAHVSIKLIGLLMISQYHKLLLCLL